MCVTANRIGVENQTHNRHRGQWQRWAWRASACKRSGYYNGIGRARPVTVTGVAVQRARGVDNVPLNGIRDYGYKCGAESGYLGMGAAMRRAIAVVVSVATLVADTPAVPPRGISCITWLDHTGLPWTRTVLARFVKPSRGSSTWLEIVSLPRLAQLRNSC